MLYRIDFRPSANSQFWKLEKAIRDRLRPRIDGLALDPRPAGCKKLQGSANRYRIRVGDYRIVYEIRESTLIVLLTTEVWTCRDCGLVNTTAPFLECDQCWLGICERCGEEDVTGGRDCDHCDTCREEIGDEWPSD